MLPCSVVQLGNVLHGCGLRQIAGGGVRQFIGTQEVKDPCNLACDLV